MKGAEGDKSIFVSVGRTSTDEQEKFVRAIEDRLRTEGLDPHTVGRNTFSADAPLKNVKALMGKCRGTVIIAFERHYFPTGIEFRGGPKAQNLHEVRLPTPFNQIEAGMAYCHGHPLLVIVEKGLKPEGLLERGFDWYVQYVDLSSDALTTMEFNGVLASWKAKVLATSSAESSTDIAGMTLGQLFGGLKPTHLWSVLGALAALLAGAFSLGARITGGN